MQKPALMFLLLSGSLGLGTAVAHAKEHTVIQKDKNFSQEAITIEAGDTIVFKNDDKTSHNVFSSSESMKFNLGVQAEGKESSQKFDTPGEGEVRCAIHPKMKLKVTVNKKP